MSKFSEILLKLNDIQNSYIKNFQNDLQNAFDLLEEYDGKNKRVTQTKAKTALTVLQSITEDEEKSSTPVTKPVPPNTSKQSAVADKPVPSKDENKENLETSAPANTLKRSRVGGDSPEPDSRRPKRNAGLVAQSLVSKQVNVNLNQKLRREESPSGGKRSTRNRRKKDDEPDKEVLLPQPVKIKEEKLSIPSDPTDTDSDSLNVNVKQEAANNDMPPPALPLPKPRGRAKKVPEDETTTTKRPSTRNKKQAEDMPPPPMPAPRATRASSRASSRSNTSVQVQGETQEVPETRSKRTRARKKAEDTKTQQSLTDSDASPDKPRPKRTRRGKANDTQSSQDENTSTTDTEKRTRNNKPKEPEIVLKKEKISQTIDKSNTSPILKSTETDNSINKTTKVQKKNAKDKDINKEEYKDNHTVVNIDKTVVLNGVCDAPNVGVDEQNQKAAMNETVILDRHSRETIVLDKQTTKPLDATVVLDKACPPGELTDDNSMITDDSEHYTPTTNINQPANQPNSAVKEKVQQFEELAQRTTRTKTRAMAKKDEQPDNYTPPDKIMKPVFSAETLNKMNSLIFNGKPQTQISSSAAKPRANIVSNVRSFIPCSASKLATLPVQREATEEKLKEDARKKKEALLEAKREAQRRKREEKTAAAAAARSAAERDRMATMEALTRALLEKQAHIDIKEREKQLTLEKKKQELARKAAETDSRRRAEEVARQKRLADEQRKAEMQRKLHLKEAEATKKEAEKMAKEMEKRQKEYIEKLKLKQKLEAEKLLTPSTPQLALPPMEPVYMSDGFQYLNSDDDDEDVDKPKFPVPEWSTRKMRWPVLEKQWHVRQSVVDALFSVRVHSPDLREMFPTIRAVKRTSSAVWRTPPYRLDTVQE